MSAVVYFCCLRSVFDDNLITAKSIDGRNTKQYVVAGS